MRLIDADALKEMLIKERDSIPLSKTERYSFGVGLPNPLGMAMRGGVNKALRCMENTPTIDSESLRPQGEWVEGDWTGEVRCYYINRDYGNRSHLCEHTPLNCWNCHMNEVKHKRGKKCSVCGKQERFERPYCPNCGAFMKGAGEDA